MEPEYVSYFRVWTSLDELFLLVESTTAYTVYNMIVFSANGDVYINATGMTGVVCERL